MTFDPRQRYARQIQLPEIGEAGQGRLAEASCLVVGTGGLGSPALHHLVASGVGRVGFVEFDTVDITNLHRQTLFSTSDIGRPKAEATLERLRAINPDITVECHPKRLDASNADALLAGYDVVVDGSDTFATRYVVNDAAVRTGTPDVFASVGTFSGQASVFAATGGPCYRCLFPEPPPPGLIPNCAEGGVLGVVPSLFGTIQASEALKLLLGIGEPLVGRLLMIDLLAVEVREIGIDRDPQCPACGLGRLAEVADAGEVSPGDLRVRMAAGGVHLLDVREAAERSADHIGGRHIPVGQLEARLFELELWKAEEVIVYCKSGGRSAQAARLLAERGHRALSLRGGLDAFRRLS
ncbi:ThiF family adenylyltransferase [Rubrivirga sp. IMCC45206]|uniref:ThiF family adenylyltransferase n=1 Tax=Rubrivirga sp. IMCC45206 TaxID=3391614 RepID=UPI0039902C42